MTAFEKKLWLAEFMRCRENHAHSIAGARLNAQVAVQEFRKSCKALAEEAVAARA